MTQHHHVIQDGKGGRKFEGHYVSCNLCHELVPEISKETEEAYRFHPACRPEAVAKREVAKEAQRTLKEWRDKHGEK